MWEPRCLTMLWASTACYKVRFSFSFNMKIQNEQPCRFVLGFNLSQDSRYTDWGLSMFPHSIPGNILDRTLTASFHFLPVIPSCIVLRLSAEQFSHWQRRRKSLVKKWLSFNWTANGVFFLPGGRGVTIRNNTQNYTYYTKYHTTLQKQ
jgi:hypothetical protein